MLLLRVLHPLCVDVFNHRGHGGHREKFSYQRVRGVICRSYQNKKPRKLNVYRVFTAPQPGLEPGTP